MEAEENQTLIIIDIPFAQKQNDTLTYETVPLGIIVTPKNIVTVCLKDTMSLREFTEGKVKNVYTNLKTSFIFHMLYNIA